MTWEVIVRERNDSSVVLDATDAVWISRKQGPARQTSAWAPIGTLTRHHGQVSVLYPYFPIKLFGQLQSFDASQSHLDEMSP